MSLYSNPVENQAHSMVAISSPLPAVHCAKAAFRAAFLARIPPVRAYGALNKRWLVSRQASFAQLNSVDNVRSIRPSALLVIMSSCGRSSVRRLQIK